MKHQYEGGIGYKHTKSQRQITNVKNFNSLAQFPWSPWLKAPPNWRNYTHAHVAQLHTHSCGATTHTLTWRNYTHAHVAQLHTRSRGATTHTLTWIARIHSHTYIYTVSYNQRCAKRQLSYYCSVHSGSVRVSVFHRTVTWTTESVPCVRDHSRACAYT